MTLSQRGRPTTVRRLVAGMTAAVVAVGGALLTAAPAHAADPPASFTLTGSGFGHGVGMSQFGAYELARQGALSGNILKHYYRGVSLPWASTPSNVLVQVYGKDPLGRSGYGDSNKATTVTVRGGDWRLRDEDFKTLATGTGTTKFAVTVTAGGRSRVTVDGKKYYDQVLRIQWSGTRYYKRTGKTAVASVAGAHGTYKNGQLTTSARNGIANITNDVRLNTEYLYGIAEMPSSWGLNGGLNALTAQAITARSYAMTKSLDNRCRCQVVDDVRDQNYTGWKKESEGTNAKYGKVWKKAVDRTTRSTTKARVLTYGGKPVATHYYSSSGGRTSDSEDVWVSRIAYERSVSDPYSKAAPGNSYRSWTRKITQSQAKALFGLSNVASIKVTKKWTSGQARTLTATSTSGKKATVTGKADAIRSKVGKRTTAGSMPASWITKITANS
ncbi:SpoIID/LytB domain-containing protein [Isoptericola sp. NEAU-Y5]|uniref:SpoIID/LytB domain-containing protein n=1 Tax=Isoptericola luteus TaxID=2879484 RepID=A0ABS7ZFY3_9MICO|nr:SpoIID/LytB domain-containing protein [Isoptericola sp. NEAU-Y5]MCA5892759.1 SpoIID/LytB domain-containing protein [Isoptericola sp. NEAU-Y5]